jgi:hypothetical protein
MVYEIHVNCDINVRDRSGGNVYTMVMDQSYTPEESKVIMLKNLDNALIGNIQPTPDDSDELVVTSRNFYITKYNRVNIDDANILDLDIPLELDTTYYVYVMAIDSLGKQSNIFEDSNLSGQILPRNAPEINLVKLTRSPVDTRLPNLRLECMLGDPVYFEYYIATFNAEYSTDRLKNFFSYNIALAKNDNELIHYGNVYTGFTQIKNETVTKNINVLITSLILDIDDLTNYDPIIDNTIHLYTYVYAINAYPHLQSINHVPQQILGIVPELQNNITLSNMNIIPNDTNFTVEFEVNSEAISNVNYYIGVFSEALDFISSQRSTLTGDSKRLIYEKGMWGVVQQEVTTTTIYEYYDKSEKSEKNLVSNDKYYVYIALVNHHTGQIGTILERDVDIKKIPMIQSLIVNFDVTV